MTNVADFDLQYKNCNPKLLLDCGPPRALYKVNPRLIFGREWWDEARRWAYAKYNNKCAACGKGSTKLEAHEMYEIDGKKGIITVKDIVPMCWKCHSFVHQDMHRSLLATGKMTHSQVAEVLKHGRDLLMKYKIRNVRKDPNSYNIKPSDWRLNLYVYDLILRKYRQVVKQQVL